MTVKISKTTATTTVGKLQALRRLFERDDVQVGGGENRRDVGEVYLLCIRGAMLELGIRPGFNPRFVQALRDSARTEAMRFEAMSFEGSIIQHNDRVIAPIWTEEKERKTAMLAWIDAAIDLAGKANR